MFFINHREKEIPMKDSQSMLNLHEASFIVALCKYLIQQGYETSQVTILAMYKAQSNKIKELLKGEPLLEGICATTVDNFQGEENEIILVSFVRSNEKGNIGFLKTANRINVAFSRAKIGLYCVGNFETMARKGGRAKEDHFPWYKLVEKLRKQNAIGDGLKVYCQNHGTKSMVKSKRDFVKRAPEGGCLSVCNTALQCGHLCSRVCHSINMDEVHAEMSRYCCKDCNRSCAAGHSCPLKCHYQKECKKCTVLVQKSLVKCEHTLLMFCWQKPASVHCTKKVLAQSPCGHTVTIECYDSKNVKKILSTCGEICNVEPKCQPGHRCTETCHFPKPCEKCVVVVDKLRMECQHTVQAPCWMSPSHFYCPHPCEKNRSCGHKCKECCGAICDDVVCVEKVQTKSPCGHTVTIDCCDAKSDLKLLSTCGESCNVELKCGHLCKGSCGRCMHGRLHIRYSMKIYILSIIYVIIECIL